MKYHRKYGDLIWTDHVLDKLRDRHLPQELAWSAVENPDSKTPGKTPGSTEFIRHMGDKTVTTIAKPNEKNEWVVISAWIDPPATGTTDAKSKTEYYKFQQSSLWQKIWITLKSQIGL